MDNLTYMTMLSDTAEQVRRTEEQVLAGVIARAIERDAHQGVRELRVEITERTLMLTGECASFYTKQLAQETAFRYCEGRHVCNEICVTATAPR
jgi:hypothetical protein